MNNTNSTKTNITGGDTMGNKKPGCKFFTRTIDKEQFETLQGLFHISGYVKGARNKYERITITKNESLGDYQSCINYEITRNRDCYLVYRIEFINGFGFEQQLNDLVAFASFEQAVNFIKTDDDSICKYLTIEEYEELFK